MAKKSMIAKQQRKPKFQVRGYNRCKICGRPHAYMRKFGICRICLSWLTKARSPALPNPVGRTGALRKEVYPNGCY